MVPISPVEGDSQMSKSPTITTVEMKCGRYRMVWNPLRKRLAVIWLIISASMIGMGKPASMLYRLSHRVLRMVVLHWKELKNRMKFLSSGSDQVLPMMPREFL